MTFNLRYFAWTCLLLIIELIIGIVVHDSFIRPYMGDFLVVILIYCFIKSFFKIPVLNTVIFVLLFSFLVETLQYFNFVEVIGLEKYKIAKIIIGNSFSWSDIFAYIAGIIFTLFIEYFIKLKKTKMKSLLLFFSFYCVCMNLSFAQQDSVTYYKDKYLTKSSIPTKAKYKKVESTDIDGVLTKKIYNLSKSCLLRLEKYKNDKPTGIWISNSDDCTLYMKRDFADYFVLNKGRDTVYYNIIKNPDSANCIMAKFPGGEQAMFKFINENIHYPQEAIEQKTREKIYISFIVRVDGSIAHTSVLRGEDPYLCYAACELIKSMPKWIPATKNGQPIETCFVLPINFTR